jgi:predicted enzyme related to lactoylglutathione lyase
MRGQLRVKAQGTTLYPFVPSGRNFDTALEFFAAIGFETSWRHEGLAGMRFGGAYFMLQQIDVPQWQENQMITFEVTDLDDYWAALDSMGLPERFPGVKLRPPTDCPWGREIHFIDPGGVCWHVRQAANAK